MRDIRIVINGNGESFIDLTREVSGKDLYRQKALVNIITVKGSDPVFPDRGTDLMKKCLSGTIYDNNGLRHIGNFAALDTTFFVLTNEYAAVDKTPDMIKKIAVYPYTVNMVESSVTFKAVIEFTDGTTIKEAASIAQAV